MAKSTVLQNLKKGTATRRFFGGVKLNVPPNKDRTVYSNPIGLELELEGGRLPTRIPSLAGIKAQWVAIGDGSLRNGGREYILSEPCKEDETRPLLNHLFGFFINHGAKIQLSNRCSTHVHINSSDMYVNEQTSFIVLWTMFEQALINWCGEDRVGNLFCLSNKDTNGITVEDWRNALLTGGFTFNNNHKYSALNLGNYSNLGTFELRCMRGVTNPDTLMPWITFLLQLKKEAQSTYRDPTVIGRDLSELGALQLFMGICERANISDFGKEVLNLPENSGREFEESCFESFRECQSVVYEYPWQDLFDDIYKEYIPDPFERPNRDRTVHYDRAGGIRPHYPPREGIRLDAGIFDGI